MSTNDAQNFYYSGQGVVLVGDRDALGNPRGLIPVGNVTDLKIQLATTVIEHKDSQNGARAIDLRLTTEIKGNLSMTIDNFIADNLARAVRGDNTIILPKTGQTEAPKLYLGKVVPFQRMQASNVVLKRGSTALTAFSAEGTPYDYKVNLAAGSIKFNDGATTLVDKITTGGVVPSAVTVGNPTQVTVANTALVGDYVTITGLTGADAALLNGKAFQIVAASATAVSLNVDTTGKTITIGTPLAAFDGDVLALTYDYGSQKQVDALTQAAPIKFMRFEGLNTADGNNPVIIEVFKFMTDPLKELAMISDNIGQFVLDGSFLSDPLRSTGSKFFREILLR